MKPIDKIKVFLKFLGISYLISFIAMLVLYFLVIKGYMGMEEASYGLENFLVSLRDAFFFLPIFMVINLIAIFIYKGIKKLRERG